MFRVPPPFSSEDSCHHHRLFLVDLHFSEALTFTCAPYAISIFPIFLHSPPPKSLLVKLCYPQNILFSLHPLSFVHLHGQPPMKLLGQCEPFLAASLEPEDYLHELLPLPVSLQQAGE